MIDTNIVVCADSEEYLKRVENKSVDIVLTSPPYNFDMGYTDYEDDILWEKYYDKLFSILRECERVLKVGGRLILNVQPNYKLHQPTHHKISQYCTYELGLIWRDEILWEKNNYNCGYCTWGSWKSPSSPYMKYTWEFIEVFSKGDIKHDGNTDYIDISADEFKKWTTAKWSIAPEQNMKEYDHPAMFPQELVMRLLKMYSYKNDIVLDPFNGVGTTSAVCKMLHRKYIGIDISEEYCNKAKERLKYIQEELF